MIRLARYSGVYFLLTYLLKEHSQPILFHQIVYLFCIMSNDAIREDRHMLSLVQQCAMLIPIPLNRYTFMQEISRYMTFVINKDLFYLFPVVFIGQEILQDILWYASWLAHIMVMCRHHIVPGWNEKRICAIMTLCSSAILSPVGLFLFHAIVSGKDLSFPSLLGFFDNVAKFYIAFAGCDMLFSWKYYPGMFPLLEGYVHHITTGLFAWWCLQNNRSIIFSCSFIVEPPTVILSLIRMFPACRWMRRVVFPVMFFLFRIVAFGFCVLRLWNTGYLQDHVILGISALFTGMNIFWLSKLVRPRPGRDIVNTD